jgi:hypothetical protein
MVPPGLLPPLDEKYIWRSSLKYAPGNEFRSEPERSIWQGISTNLIVMAFLTLVFGLLGLFGAGVFGNSTNANLTPFLDIAKIFAGAIVGSVGTTAVAAVTRKPS